MVLIMRFKHCKQPSLAQLKENSRFCKKENTVESLITTPGYINCKANRFDSKIDAFE